MFDVITPPSDDHPEKGLLGATCHLCQTALSVPRTKTSMRPSALRLTATSEVSTPPCVDHPDHAPCVTMAAPCAPWGPYQESMPHSP